MTGFRLLILPLFSVFLILMLPLGSCDKLYPDIPIQPIDTIPEQPLPHDTVNYYIYQGSKIEILKAGAIGHRDWLSMRYYFTLVLAAGNLGIDTHFDEFTGSGKCMEFWLHTAPNVSNLPGQYKHEGVNLEDYAMIGKLRTSGVFGSYSGETKNTNDGKLVITKPGSNYVVTFTCNIGSDTIVGTYTGPITVHIGD